MIKPALSIKNFSIYKDLNKPRSLQESTLQGYWEFVQFSFCIEMIKFYLREQE